MIKCRAFRRTSAAVLLVGSFFLFSRGAVFAQTPADTVSDRRAALERELERLETEADAQRRVLEDRQQQSASLERDVDILNAKIKKAQASIKARTIVISQLSQGIGEKAATIDALSEKIAREKDSLAQLFRAADRVETSSLVELMLNDKTITEFFQDVDSFGVVGEALRRSFDEIERDKAETAAEKDELEGRRREEVDLRAVQELERRRTEEQETERKTILRISRGLEAEYQRLILAKELDAAKIRTELFQLRGSAAIPFEKALTFAVAAAKKTGVRAAFILGIIAEESNLGENIGTGSWRVDMKAPRDTDPFLDITRRLNLNPDRVPVSKKPWYGYGGAMGPAQFLPSTWILYEDRIADATGHRPPNPWEPEDSFMAAALYLKDSGAARGTAAAERLAALCYLAGCANAKKRAYAFYGDDVKDLAERYQRQIDVLQTG